MKKLILIIAVALMFSSCLTTDYWTRVNIIIEEEGGIDYYGE